MTEAQTVSQALLYAAKKHTGQHRKGEKGEPYVNHLIEVVDILAQFTGGADPELLAAGALHDTIEDTDTKYEDLKKSFGENIADIVQECTDDKSLPKAERKRLQIENASHKSDKAKLVKIADKISNLRSIIESPPADWSLERKQEYFTWAKKVVDGLRGVNEGLDAEFDKTYKLGAQKLGMGA